jgi:hypothetical protein
MLPIIVNIAVEDRLSEAITRKIIKKSQHHITIGTCYCKGGYGYLKRRILGFNRASRITPFFVLADLEDECPPIQIKNWLTVPIEQNLLFRIAVREVESWLLADRDGFASFVGVSADIIPNTSDNIDDPKKFLINLTKRSRNRTLREAIVPALGSTARIGPDYNGQLIQFVDNHWDIEAATRNSSSLARTIKAIVNFKLT